MADTIARTVEHDVEPDRVRRSTRRELNRRADLEIQHCLETLASEDREAISRHIDSLDREWGVERYLQANMPVVTLTGLLLGSLVDRRFLLLSAAAFGFFFQHAVQGWCPPLPIFRRMGARTRREINREKYALKALRGDFEEMARPRHAS